MSGLGSATAVADEAAAAAKYPAKVDLAGRDRKSQSGAELASYPAGSLVEIECQAYGEWAYGSFIWDRTTDDTWVADQQVKTGTDGFVAGLPRCDDDPPVEPAACTMGHGRIDGPAGPATGTDEERIARIIAEARRQTGVGLSYAWGGGGKGGPSCGLRSASPGGHVDYDRLGFDCSGYTLYAYWKGAGIDIGAHTGAQYNAGRRVPYAERRPGDLIFWGSDGTTSHVAIYLGGDRMLEAAPPRDANSVHEIDVRSPNRFSSVVRVIG